MCTPRRCVHAFIVTMKAPVSRFKACLLSEPPTESKPPKALGSPAALYIYYLLKPATLHQYTSKKHNTVSANSQDTHFYVLCTVLITARFGGGTTGDRRPYDDQPHPTNCVHTMSYLFFYFFFNFLPFYPSLLCFFFGLLKNSFPLFFIPFLFFPSNFGLLSRFRASRFSLCFVFIFAKSVTFCTLATRRENFPLLC